MPWVEAKTTEYSFKNKLLNLLYAKGWEQVAYFTRVVYPKKVYEGLPPDVWENPYYTSEMLYPENYMVKFAVAEHTIIKNSKGDMFGITYPYTFETPVRTLFEARILVKDEDGTPSRMISYARGALQGHISWRRTFDWYFYMLDEYCGPYRTSDDDYETVHIGKYYGDGDVHYISYAVEIDTDPTIQWCLDIETFYYSTQERTYQSPIVYLNFRPVTTPIPVPYEELLTVIPSYDEEVEPPYVLSTIVPYQDNPWYEDSVVRLSGYIDDLCFLLFVQVDDLTFPEDNRLQRIPIYFGRFNSFYATTAWEWDGGVAFFGGTDVGTYFDYTKPDQFPPPIMPLNRIYGPYPSNGIDTIMVKKNIFGQRYQAHHLAWFSPTQKFPPPRITEDGRQYPKAWKNHTTDWYRTKNPHGYIDELMGSWAYIVSKYDGVYGTLPCVVLTNEQMIDGDIIEVPVDGCSGTVSEFKYFSNEGASVLSKRNTTHFTPAGLGVKTDSVIFPYEVYTTIDLPAPAP